ncbi:hypothetical protein GCM10023224_05170 [Streptomonospora halophila]|uniref:Uncharacterized protein n=1 Tax=Streptomonospora halophila TaxID=427369 RepID=A0ABP9G5W2_9ACTN
MAELEQGAPPTKGESMASAARLLRWAEGETDLARMERFTDLAQCWINLASLDDEQGA